MVGNIVRRIVTTRVLEFTNIFKWKDEFGRGRTLLLINNFLTGIGNVLLTGIFYTSFLATNGIDIVRMGIITFIPYIAWSFSLFSPMVLSLFKKRRFVVLFNHIFYYVTTVLATTIMPLFVSDYGRRTFWFGILLFAGNMVNALLGSGTTAWHINFLPKDQERRNVYFSYMTLTTNLVSAASAIAASLLTDSFTGSDQMASVVRVMRYIGFTIMIINGLLLFLIPREYDYPKTERALKLHDVFSMPLKAKKFLLTAGINIIYNFVGNLNNNTWTYYVMNVVGIRYIMLYSGTIVCAIGSLFLMPFFRNKIARYSWEKVLTVSIAVSGLSELFIGFVTEYTIWIYIVVSIVQGINTICLNLIFANLFYVNLPKSGWDVYATFWNFITNFTILISTVLGACFISFTELHGPWQLLNLPFYGSQFLVWVKFVLFFAMCYYLRKITPRIRPDE